MSITDIPLVVAYRDALYNALEQLSTSESNEESNTVIEVFRGIRTQDETPSDAPAHDLAVESVVREKFIDLVSSSDIHKPEFKQVWDLVDITNTLSEHELSEPSLAFYLIEELLDSQTIDGCRVVFDYLESRRQQMIRKNFKTKSLVILRCCNELLRRLSRAEETVFCGRVFIYLFQTFPLGDRSSVNLRGVFHTENVTTYDDVSKKSDDAIQPMEIDSDLLQPVTSRAQTPSSTALDVDSKTGRSTPSTKPIKPDPKADTPPDLDALYPVFWSLQGLYSDPTKLFDTQSMQQFKDGMTATLSCFRWVSKHSAPTAEPLDMNRRGVKRKHGDSRNAKEAMTSTSLASKFNPKYLTSRDLFDLEIHDMAFRRHFLVQGLIMLDLLLSLSPTAKSKLVGLSNRSVLYAYTLSEEDTKWVQSMRQSIALYLQQSGIGSEGSLYYRMVDTVLSRDKNWARWKAENCPPISRPPIDPETFLAAQKSLREASRIPNLINPPGSNDFNFLMETQPLASLKNPSKRHQIPTLQEYYKSIQGDDLDLEMAMDNKEISEIEERKAGKLWRALRSATGRKFVLCEQIKNGENLAALIGDGDGADAVDGDGDGDEDKDGNKFNGHGGTADGNDDETDDHDHGHEPERGKTNGHADRDQDQDQDVDVDVDVDMEQAGDVTNPNPDRDDDMAEIETEVTVPATTTIATTTIAEKSHSEGGGDVVDEEREEGEEDGEA